MSEKVLIWRLQSRHPGDFFFVLVSGGGGGGGGGGVMVAEW